jgi:hypothetical protein
MPTRFFYFHLALWCALFAVFLVLSAPIVGRGVMENRLGPIETNRSIDSYLRALTGIENGSVSLPDTFQRLNKNGRLVIFVEDENAKSQFLGMMVGYVSWPRDIQLVTVSKAQVEKEIAKIAPRSVAGLVFCSMNPPSWLTERVRLGSSIILIPTGETTP